ncbi:MAG: 3-methyladenine DNA glycosylase Tag [Lentisphaeria bacterium]|jgi:3-methyladenine DNA glycosylase Tag
MQKFSSIRERAELRKGGKKALVALLPLITSREELAQLSDDRYLSLMVKVVNQAGFNWSVIEKKWPQFEEAFFDFNTEKLSRLSIEQWEAYTKDVRVVRNWQKIKATMMNVGFVRQVSAEYGSFGKFIADWPQDDQVGLMNYMKKHGSRLGGQSAQWFMRYVGKDSYVTTPDMIQAIRNSGVEIAENPSSQRDFKKIQDTMNRWRQESGLPYTHLSKIAAFSIGEL